MRKEIQMFYRSKNFQLQAGRKYNREVKQAINNYNNAVRQHNTRVRQNRMKIESELRRLNSQPVFRITTAYTTSVRSVNSAYNNVAAFYDATEPSNVLMKKSRLR